MMRFLQVAVGLLVAELAASSPLTRRGVNFNWGSEKVRGVNIGGWLVLEPWITPSIFGRLTAEGYGNTIIDEWTMGEQLGDKALDILRPHWDTWVTLADFQKIAANGFNTVRIPIGYWAYMKFNDPYVQGAAPYMDAAIDWARQTGLKVWVDLHGAPGSQNGFDNSGHNGTVGWNDGDTMAQTRAVLQIIANKYAQPQYQDVVVAIELMNEPLSFKINGGPGVVGQYYKDGFGDVRVISDTPVVMHDGFEAASYWNDVLPSPDSKGVIIDHHEYQVFMPDLLNLTPAQHVQAICSNAGFYADNVNHWVVVGEWTGAMTDCAPYLNGYGIGSRWEGTMAGSPPSTRKCGGINDITTWTETTKSDTRNFIEVQLDVYEQRAEGFVFWNFKTEGAAEWDLFRLLDAGVFPNLFGRQPASLCSS